LIKEGKEVSKMFKNMKTVGDSKFYSLIYTVIERDKAFSVFKA
jgi:hypothetical protein